MTIVEKKPVPIYEIECFECHSIFQFKKSETDCFHDCIICPVCRRLNYASTSKIACYQTEAEEEKEE